MLTKEKVFDFLVGEFYKLAKYIVCSVPIVLAMMTALAYAMNSWLLVTIACVVYAVYTPVAWYLVNKRGDSTYKMVLWASIATSLFIYVVEIFALLTSM